jgi:hypothetical protein
MSGPLESGNDLARRGTSRSPLGNRILDAIPQSELEGVAPSLRRILLQRDQTLFRPGEPIAALHFPVDAFVWCWLETTGTSRPTPVLATGYRGALEWNHVLGFKNAQTFATVLSTGSAWRLEIEAFSRLGPTSALHRLLLRFANANVLANASRLACNSEHNVDQRLARWLLWVSDERGGDGTIAITHQQIAEIAAIRRPSVSLGISRLQRSDLLQVNHRHIRIADRAGLEAVVCRCYWEIRRQSEAVFHRESAA